LHLTHPWLVLNTRTLLWFAQLQVVHRLLLLSPLHLCTVQTYLWALRFKWWWWWWWWWWNSIGVTVLPFNYKDVLCMLLKKRTKANNGSLQPGSIKKSYHLQLLKNEKVGRPKQLDHQKVVPMMINN